MSRFSNGQSRSLRPRLRRPRAPAGFVLDPAIHQDGRIDRRAAGRHGGRWRRHRTRRGGAGGGFRPRHFPGAGGALFRVSRIGEAEGRVAAGRQDRGDVGRQVGRGDQARRQRGQSAGETDREHGHRRGDAAEGRAAHAGAGGRRAGLDRCRRGLAGRRRGDGGRGEAALGLRGAAPCGPARRAPPRVAAQCDRPLHPRPARSGGAGAVARG